MRMKVSSRTKLVSLQVPYEKKDSSQHGKKQQAS